MCTKILKIFRHILKTKTNITYVLIEKKALIIIIKKKIPKMYSSVLCPICKTYNDTQEHVLLCKKYLVFIFIQSRIRYLSHSVLQCKKVQSRFMSLLLNGVLNILWQLSLNWLSEGNLEALSLLAKQYIETIPCEKKD